MRYSNYNLYFRTLDNQNIIYNTLTNQYVVLNNKDIREKLIQHEMITSLSIDEEQAKCDAVFYQNTNNSTLSITIITTRQCNFSCKYCAQCQSDEIMNEEIYQSIEHYILRNINTFIFLKIILFGGEPTLAIDCYERFLHRIQDICKYYRKQHQVAMITNGYLLDDDMVTRLYQAHVWQYTITLDGDPNLHNAYRHLKNGEPTFQKIYENLKRIGMRQDLQRLSVVIRINITKDTAKKIEKWRAWYDELLTYSNFWLELNIVENRGGNSIKEISNVLISTNDDSYISVANAFSKYNSSYEKLKPNIFVCGYVNTHSLTVDCNGKLRACSKLYVDNHIGKMSRYGLVHIEKSMDKFKIKYDTKCHGCAVEPLCHGKRCGFSTICIWDEVLFIIQENLKKKGIFICQVLERDSLILPTWENI